MVNTESDCENLGFGGRIWLTKSEWQTYCRRKPVRYVKREHSEVCAVCRTPGHQENPLQHAHRIGFNMGIIQLGLTPDYLDSHKNIVSAHRRECNSKAELNLSQAINLLRLEKDVRHLPSYLPSRILKLWELNLE